MDKPLTVHGFAFDGLDISSNPFGRLVFDPDDRIHVAVAHGSEMGSMPPGKDAYAPFQASDAVCDGLAYLALGHFHAMKEITGPFNTHVYYSGSPEGHGFGEAGMRHYLEIEIGDNEIRVTPKPSAGAVFEHHEVDCTDLASSQELIDRIRSLPHDATADRVIRIRLTGSARIELSSEFPSVQDALTGFADAVVWVDDTRVLEEYDVLAKDPTSFGGFVARINEEIELESDANRLLMLERSREVGIAAYRNHALPVHGVERA